MKYYIDPFWGQDSNTGTDAKDPWRTLEGHALCAAAGGSGAVSPRDGHEKSLGAAGRIRAWLHYVQRLWGGTGSRGESVH